MAPAIFDFTNYKAYLRAWADSQPNKGRGAFTKMAQATGVHTSSLSQIVNGDKDFNIDHVIRLAELLQLTAVEKDYLIALLMHEKAGQEPTRIYWKDKLGELKEKSRALLESIPQVKLTEDQKAIFYSSWLYQAVQLVTTLQGVSTTAEIARKLSYPVDEIDRIVQFLLSTGLMIQKNDRLQMGKVSTFIPHTSPLIARLHHNWRIRALDHHERLDSKREIAYTGPMTLSHADAIKIQALLVELSEKVYSVAAPSPKEAMYCLNIDWFQVL